MVEKSHTAGWLPHIYEPFRQLGQKIADWFAPRAEASSDAAAYEIVVELPGVRPDDVEIALNDNSLTIRGEKRLQREESGRTYFFSEREYGVFERSFRLPPDSDVKNISANFADGVVTIRVPHLAKEKREEVKIPIHYQYGSTHK